MCEIFVLIFDKKKLNIVWINYHILHCKLKLFLVVLNYFVFEKESFAIRLIYKNLFDFYTIIYMM